MNKNLTAFLAQNAKKIDNVHCVASDRFVDPETGKAIPWAICCITAAENAAIRKSCMRTVQVPGRKGQFTQDIDANAYLAKVAVRCTVFPNLNDAELQQSYAVMGAEQLITAMLTPAEFEDYSGKVLEVNGFQSGDEMVEEAKN
ncbi:MAG: phage portal protein [Clostridia bacterium]|nr:phage portal protein [Clostridia bacterium]